MTAPRNVGAVTARRVRQPLLPRIGAWLTRGDKTQSQPLVPPIDTGFELFEGIAPREMTFIRSLFTPVRVPAGRVIATEGQPAREFFLILEGRVGIARDGVPEIVLDGGCHLGELPMLDRTGTPVRVATAHTLEPSWIASCNRRQFATMMDASPEVARRVMQLAGKRRSWLATTADTSRSAQVDSYPRHLLAAAPG